MNRVEELLQKRKELQKKLYTLAEMHELSHQGCVNCSEKLDAVILELQRQLVGKPEKISYEHRKLLEALDAKINELAAECAEFVKEAMREKIHEVLNTFFQENMVQSTQRLLGKED